MEKTDISKTSTEFSKLPFANFFMFAEVMKTPNICKQFLTKLLHKPIRSLSCTDKEHDITDTADYHGIRLDVYANDNTGTRYDIEMQRSDNDTLEKRIRYYQSGIDRTFLQQNRHYDELGQSYVIFVCDFDYYGQGLAAYERTSTINGVPYDDGSHVIILNTHYKKPGTIGGKPTHPDILEFLDYIRAKNDNRVTQSKLVGMVKNAVVQVRGNSEKEKAFMTVKEFLKDEQYKAHKKGLAEGRVEGRAEGRVEGLQQGRVEMIVLDAKEEGQPHDFAVQKVVRRLNISEEEARRLVDKIW